MIALLLHDACDCTVTALMLVTVLMPVTALLLHDACDSTGAYAERTVTGRRTGESSVSGMSCCRVDSAGARLAWCGKGGGSKLREGRRQRAVAYYRCFLYSGCFLYYRCFSHSAFSACCHRQTPPV